MVPTAVHQPDATRFRIDPTIQANTCTYVVYKSWLCGVFCVYTTRTEARESLQCKLLKAEVLGSYIHRIHHVTMIHVIYTLIAWY